MQQQQIVYRGPRSGRIVTLSYNETTIILPLNYKEPSLEIADHLRALELELLTNTTRKNAARVSSLLADTFQEFGSSGQVFSRDEIIRQLQQEAPVSISLVNFKMTLLSEGVALVTFQSQQHQQNAPPITALRSSIWIQNGNDWRIVFHQGTRLP